MLFVLSTIVLGWALLDTGYLVGIIVTTAGGLFANWLSLRIFEGRHMSTSDSGVNRGFAKI